MVRTGLIDFQMADDADRPLAEYVDAHPLLQELIMDI